jgi:hypothetical protein
MGEKASESRVVMAKIVAGRWLDARTRDEHRLKVYYGPREIKNLPGLLRSFRDEKLKIGSIDPIPDLGIQEEFDSITIWSTDRVGLVHLREWFEERGCETSGIW